MSRRSGRITLQARDSNALVPDVKAPLKKRRSEPSKKELQPAAKKQSYEIQKCWSEDGASPCLLIETPHKELEPADPSSFKQYRFKNLFIKASPIPRLSWASSDDVWIKMLNKELKYVHDKSYLQRHPKLQPKMRAILLDWLLEVCEVYSLHRQTAYLAQDFFDRFMVTQENVNKDYLQLIGISALFIASKIEEIYPPKILDFAYVTDGACDFWDIQRTELHILKALNWNLCPETPISWLKLYAQVEAQTDGENFLVPQFSQETYIQITQLLDLCILDINALDYSYCVLAAAAFCHFSSFDVVHKVSGLTWDSVAPCVRWMSRFMDTLRTQTKPQLKNFPKVKSDARHNIQTHVAYLDLLRKSLDRPDSPECQLSPVAVGTVLTPPSSTEKPANH
ncbi:G1/S-specific cyclin-E2 [Pseudochaenichthys georgianus]|uniref:G1/S-specific cyclin-E2 n=1 Tax=Pseudochaenichthys georgianus TaxID=52239 RepID=UPI00146F0C78|nr:G1/S-specific cyclin-E2 [Pseudochaenichthys georgianus]XP_033933448.1 G1/S-specific cyclin-E2 [Pseudochaenichthys georgianus]XP_033933449.1 G1/S-specific cyclin-E2 [Pseudochaenichthys georgianus]XP_033933450.1 G1/S-specific cyclin-E2 [Pseudochaenichthys georgianus]